MGMEVELVSVTLDGEDGSSSGCGVERLGLGVVLERPPSAARQLSQQPSIPPEGGPQDPGNGPHQLTVVDRFQDLCGHPLHEGRHALGLTGGTKVAGLAGKGEQILYLSGGSGRLERTAGAVSKGPGDGDSSAGRSAGAFTNPYFVETCKQNNSDERLDSCKNENRVLFMGSISRSRE
jgi:hypothetical protein